MTSIFVTAPEFLCVKPKSRELHLTATLIAFLIHGFVPFKIRLLKACDKVFYAIINNLNQWKDNKKYFLLIIVRVQIFCVHKLIHYNNLNFIFHLNSV